VIPLEEALEKILSAVQPLPAETVPLQKALGRFLRAEIRSSIDLPPADNSAMDGYAVRAADLAGASKEQPVILKLSGESRAGGGSAIRVEKDFCERIFTGAVLPEGADAVVMQEDVEPLEGDIESIIFSEPAKPWENIRMQGEDLRAGAVLAKPGDELTPQRLALLAASGIASVSVGRQPRLGLLATGDELHEPGGALPPGGIYESNRTGLSALARRAGSVPNLYPVVRDDLVLTKQALQQAFDESDLVVTSGGVSVGELDWVKRAFTEIGGELNFWKIFIRPGKPFAFGRLGEKFLCAVPGNPVSAFVTFFLLARPVLLRLQGARETCPPVSLGMLAEPLDNRAQRRHFIRVRIDSMGNVKSTGAQASHILSSMSEANGLVDVPPETTLAAGTLVKVLRWD
jgi:molybdopterin molybdotransferase